MIKLAVAIIVWFAVAFIAAVLFGHTRPKDRNGGGK
jgi:hypothetical protein